MSLENEVWFAGRKPRAECDAFLSDQHQGMGTFIVRESETNVGQYTIAIKGTQAIKNFRIEKV